jgi:hypothetical protein
MLPFCGAVEQNLLGLSGKPAIWLWPFPNPSVADDG